MPVEGLAEFDVIVSGFAQDEVPREVKRIRDNLATTIYANAKATTPRGSGRPTHSGQVITRGPRRGQRQAKLGHVQEAWGIAREGRKGRSGDAAAGVAVATAPAFAAVVVRNQHFVAWFLEHGTARGMRPVHMLERAVAVAEREVAR